MFAGTEPWVMGNCRHVMCGYIVVGSLAKLCAQSHKNEKLEVMNLDVC